MFLTGFAMHSRSACSRAAHPVDVWPEEAQQPVLEVSFVRLSANAVLRDRTWELPRRMGDRIPSIVLITPRHGFAVVWSGFRTRSLGRGGSLGAAAAFASWWVVFLPATILAVGWRGWWIGWCDRRGWLCTALPLYSRYTTSISISALHALNSRFAAAAARADARLPDVCRIAR